MEYKAATKVGTIVVLGLALFGGLYMYLSHITANTYKVKVLFNDSKGLLRQSVVRMQGVAIGEVTSVELDESKSPPAPVVIIAIHDKHRIPVDSQYVIVSGLLISSAELEIHPAATHTYLPKNGTAVVIGSDSESKLASIDPDLANTAKGANKLMADLDTKLGAATDKLNVLLASTSRLVAATTDTVTATKGLVADPRLKNNLLATLNNFMAVSNNARLMTDDVRREFKDLKSAPERILGPVGTKLNDVLAHVDTILEDSNAMVKKLTEQVTDPRLQNSLQETAELFRATLAKFNQIASDVHELTGDPNTQRNLKDTATNLADLTAHLRDVSDEVDSALHKFTNGTTGGPHLPKITTIFNVSEQTGPTRLRVDADAQVALGSHALVDVGLYDLGQNTRLNLQAGNYLLRRDPLKPGGPFNSLDVRYGLYASKLGAGLDYTSHLGVGFQANLWDTNRPRLDAHALFRVNNSASIWLGVDNIFRDAVPIIGLQLKD